MIDNSDPFRFDSIEEMEKKNKELSRALSIIGKMTKKDSTSEILSKRDYGSLVKGEHALLTLLQKRKTAVSKKIEDEKKKEHQIKRGVIYLKSAFGEVNREFKIKIVLANRVRTRFWDLGDINREFDWTIESLAKQIKSKEEAIELTKKLHELMADTSHKGHAEFTAKVSEALLWVEEEMKRTRSFG